MKKEDSQFSSIFGSYTKLTSKTKKSLQNLITRLNSDPLSLQFRHPLDWQSLGLINYDKIIQKPMDLSTVSKNLKKDLYGHVEQCLDDIETIFQNSLCYNHGNQWIIDITDKCEALFRKMVKNYMPEVRMKGEGEKKRMKESKIVAKREKAQKIKIHKDEITDTSNKDKQPYNEQQTQSSPIDPPNHKPSDRQPSESHKQLFDLILQASQSSLQIVYLIIKQQQVDSISTDKNGNCNIDVKLLSEELIEKIVGFLKQAKGREEEEKAKMASKRKVKVGHVKSRFEI